VPFTPFVVEPIAFDADSQLNTTRFFASFPPHVKALMDSTTLTIDGAQVKPLELLFELQGLQQIERVYAASLNQTTLAHNAWRTAYDNTAIANAMRIAELDGPLAEDLKARLDKHLKFYINEYDLIPERRMIRKFVELLRENPGDSHHVAEIRKAMAGRKGKEESVKKFSKWQILSHLISTPFYYTPMDWGATATFVGGTTLIIGVLLSICQPCSCCRRCQDMACCCDCCEIQSMPEVQAAMDRTSAGVPASALQLTGGTSVGQILDVLGEDGELTISNGVLTIRKGRAGSPGPSRALANRAPAAAAAAAAAAAPRLTNGPPTNGPPTNAPTESASAAPIFLPAPPPQTARTLLGAAASNPAYNPPTNATAMGGAGGPRGRGSSPGPGRGGGTTLGALLQKAQELKPPSYLSKMEGAEPEAYVRALEILKARTNPEELARLGLTADKGFTPENMRIALRNLNSALQGQGGAGQQLKTSIYPMIQGNPGLKKRFIDAIRPEGGGGGSGRKNRTYRKRKASRKFSRKSRIL